jgi:hypothetical protein
MTQCLDHTTKQLPVHHTLRYTPTHKKHTQTHINTQTHTLCRFLVIQAHTVFRNFMLSLAKRVFQRTATQCNCNGRCSKGVSDLRSVRVQKWVCGALWCDFLMKNAFPLVQSFVSNPQWSLIAFRDVASHARRCHSCAASSPRFRPISAVSGNAPCFCLDSRSMYVTKRSWGWRLVRLERSSNFP